MASEALSAPAIALTVERAVVKAALAEGMTTADAEAMAEDYSGHSVRAGHATSAAQNDATGHPIQRQLRHKSFDTTAGYIREGRLFKGSSASFTLRQLAPNCAVSGKRTPYSFDARPTPKTDSGRSRSFARDFSPSILA